MNGGVQRAERATAWHQIGDHRHARVGKALRIVGNDDCPVDDAAEPRELAIQNGRAVRMQNQSSLVQPPETPRVAACEDGSRPHSGPRFMGRRISEE